MFSSKDLESLKKAIDKFENSKNKPGDDNGNPADCKTILGLNPSQLLVIAGIIGGGLEVVSVLVDREQNVQIVLSGTLRRETKTQLDRVMEQVGRLPFDEVVKAIMNNVT